MKRIILTAVFTALFAFSQAQEEQKDYSGITATEVSAMTPDEYKAFGKAALNSNPRDNNLFKLYLYEHAVRFDSGLIAGDIAYSKKVSSVAIPMDAKILNTSTYTSNGSDWVTYELEDDSKHYSITLNTKKWEVVSRFVTDL